MSMTLVRGSAPHDVPVAPPDSPWDSWSWQHPVGRAVSGAVGIGALAAAGVLGGPLTFSFWVGLLAPDAPFFIPRRSAEAPEPGVLHTEAIELYNALHNIEGPVLALLLGALTGNRPLLVGGLGWLAHLGLDRALGFGLRRSDGHIH
ncbi:MAG TPA: DUF4260 family protein [Jatrophihabitantaceae bacterium]